LSELGVGGIFFGGVPTFERVWFKEQMKNLLPPQHLLQTARMRGWDNLTNRTSI